MTTDLDMYIPSCLWLNGLFMSLIDGGVAAFGIVETLRFLGSVPRFPRSIKLCALTALTGLLERLGVTLLTVWNPTAALAFAVAWMGLKMAANWNRPGRLEASQFEPDVPEPEKWIRVARGAMSALLGSLVSLGFGVLGGLVVKGEVHLPLSLC